MRYWIHPQTCLSIAARFVAAAAILFLAFTAAAQTSNGLSPAEIQGRQLASELLLETPVTNLTQTGVLRIRNSQGTTNIPVTFETEIAPAFWRLIYCATPSDNPKKPDYLIIIHQIGQPNQYYLRKGAETIRGTQTLTNMTQSQIMSPFARSDFWIADLGLEFFHWPDQKVTGHESRRMRDCTVLESHNPNLSAGGYFRVVTWIDKQTLAIIHAEAYDANDKLLKVFDPKSVKKVNGQWQLEDIEIRNVQTHSRTWIRFNLNGDS
jgi:hypothetical protein